MKLSHFLSSRLLVNIRSKKPKIIRCRNQPSWLRLNYAFHFNDQSDCSLKRTIPEPRVPSRGSQARGTRLEFSLTFEPATLEVKGKFANHFATEYTDHRSILTILSALGKSTMSLRKSGRGRSFRCNCLELSEIITG
jgi:hypothetical protein